VTEKTSTVLSDAPKHTDIEPSTGTAVTAVTADNANNNNNNNVDTATKLAANGPNLMPESRSAPACDRAAEKTTVRHAASVRFGHSFRYGCRSDGDQCWTVCETGRPAGGQFQRDHVTMTRTAGAECTLNYSNNNSNSVAALVGNHTFKRLNDILKIYQIELTHVLS